MSGALTLATCDMWKLHDASNNPLVLALARHAELRPAKVSHADVVLYSVFGQRHQALRRTAVAMSVEPFLPDARYAQWTADWRHHPSDHHLRYPYWAMQLLSPSGSSLLSTSREALTETSAPPPRFCNFIYSNGQCQMRNSFFVALHDRKPVDALGRVFRNAEDARLGPRDERQWGATKRQVLADYRFTIAFENTEHPGYTTEKMVDAWLAGSVPIYWGNPAVVADFPAGSYLSLYEAGSMAKLIEQVLEAEHEPERYLQLRRANPVLSGLLAQRVAERADRLERFAADVAADALQHSGRRRRSLHSLLLRRPPQVVASGVRAARRAVAIRLGG